MNNKTEKKRQYEDIERLIENDEDDDYDQEELSDEAESSSKTVLKTIFSIYFRKIHQSTKGKYTDGISGPHKESIEKDIFY